MSTNGDTNNKKHLTRDQQSIHKSESSILVGASLVSKREGVDIEEETPSSSYLYSNYEKAKKYFLQKSYFNFKNDLIGVKDKLANSKESNVFEDLKYYLHDLRNHFQFIIETKPIKALLNHDEMTTSEQKLHTLTTNYLIALDKCIHHYNALLANASKYDYDSTLQVNGYRSLCRVFEKCCEQTLVTMKQIYSQKSFFLFYMKYTMFTSELNDFKAWCQLIDKLELILSISVELQALSTANLNLFVKSDQLSSTTEENLLLLQSTYQEAFFGRTCSFQFCRSLRIPLTTFTIAMASYNDSFDVPSHYRTKLGQTAKSLSSGTRYFMNPELRGKKIAHIMKTSNVEFCKFFSRLTDTPIFHVGANITTPTMVINMTKTLDSVPLRMRKYDAPLEFVKINPPYGISGLSTLRIRILSNEFREGMQTLDKSLAQRKPNKPKSRFLMLHAHGGGFISQSSKAHTVYLKPICKELGVPIVSVDYSLAPEHPFPKAMEECFYAYIWCLQNKEQLGWTGEKIIVVGDSAGGVLVTNIVQRAIVFGIRVPDALVCIYTPFLLTNSLSPSRLMSLMDPLLNTGILWRSLAAYCGIEVKEIRKTALNEPMSSVVPEGDENEKQRKERLQNTFESCYKLAELLRKQVVSYNPYISPLLSEESMLKKMPKTYLIACNDPFLDDNIEMARLLRKHGRDHELILIDNGVSHAFLNMKNLCEETRSSFHQVYTVLEKIINSN